MDSIKDKTERDISFKLNTFLNTNIYKKDIQQKAV